MTAAIPAGEYRASFERVRDALASAQRRMSTWREGHIQASCPGPMHARGDRNPSLSIDYVERDALTVMHCMTGCATGDVLAALGLDERDLYDVRWEKGVRPEGGGMRRRGPSRGSGRARSATLGKLPERLVVPPEPGPVGEFETVETYEYAAADGRVVAQVARQHREVVDTETGEVSTEKNFPQRFVSPASGRWVRRKPKGFPAVLWHMPDVAAAISYGVDPVVVCEGERDARRMRRETGMPATTNLSGAGGFSTDHAVLLSEAAEVWVVADHDLSGYRRLSAVRRELAAVGVAGIRLLLPAVTHHAADVENHFDAGFDVSGLVEVSPDQVRHLRLVAEAESIGSQVPRDVAEVHARAHQAEHAEADAQEGEWQAARRWMAEVERNRSRVLSLRDQLDAAGDVAADLRDRVVAAVSGVDAALVEVRGVVGDPVEETAPSDESSGVGQSDGGNDLADVVQHPSADWQPQPGRPLPMSRGAWRYDIGRGEVRRGVYTWLSGQWLHVAPVPYVQARIVRRDGSGRRNGLDYLVSAEEGGRGLVIEHRELRDGSWANSLGLALSDDDRIMKAASSAIRMVAEDAEEREALPAVGADGRVSVPVPETAPPGYLQSADGAREAALSVWGEIIQTAAEAPKLSLVLGASAVGPFLRELNRQTHFVALYGDAQQGKSTALKLAGGIWGDSRRVGQGVFRSWDRSASGLVRELGLLGCLPAVLDESGTAGVKGPDEWGRLISSVCQGSSRSVSQQRTNGVRVSPSWGGVLFSSGNGRLLHGLGAGRHAGVPRRVLELATPITSSEDQVVRLTGGDEPGGLLDDAYGHAGLEILGRYTTDDVSELIGQARELVGSPDGAMAKAMAKHLHAHVAGAAMLDSIAGTGTTLRDAAVEAAASFLDDCVDPEHDADRIIAAVRDAVAREPAMWPTVTEYREHRQPFNAANAVGDDDARRLPQHGVNRSLSGVLADDDSWVAMFATPWHAMCADLDVDEATALRELDARGVLQVTKSRRRRREWATSIKGVGESLYKLVLPEEPDDDEVDSDDSDGGGSGGTDEAGTTPDAAPSSSGSPSGELTVLESAQPCVACGDLASDALDGTPVHLGGDCIDNIPAERAPEPVSDDEEVPMGSYTTCDGITAEADLSGDPEPCLLCGQSGVGIRRAGTVVHIRCWEATTREELDTALASAPSTVPAPEVEPQPAPATRSRAQVRPRTAGVPAVMVCSDRVVLPDGTSQPLPDNFDHIGHAAEIGYALDLGMSMGSWTNKSGETQEWREAGQVWLDDAAAARLGIEVDALPQSSSRRREAIEKATRGGPAVTAALDAGWRIGGEGDRLRSWTRVWRDDRQAIQVVLASAVDRDVPLLADDPEPATLMHRLARFAEATGYPFHLSPQSTGIDWILQTRWKEKTTLWPALRREDLVPPAESATTERDISWSRTPTAEESRRKYVVAFDRGGSHVAGMASCELGIGDPEHHPNGCEFDPKLPGYWYVEVPESADWRFPEPLNPTGLRFDGPVPISTPRLALAIEQGFDPTIVEAYTWPEHKRILDPWYAQVRDARTLLDTDDPDDQVCRDTLKTVYTRTAGHMGSHQYMAGRAGYAPHHRHQFIARATANLIRRVISIGRATGEWPVAMQDDTIVYATDDPNFVSAWLGGDSTYGRGLGQFKPEGAALMSDHVQYLTGGRYRGKAALIDPKEWRP